MEWLLKIPRLELSSWAPSETWELLLEKWNQYGIKGIVVPVTLNQDSNQVSDNLSDLIKLAKVNNIQVWLILPVLNGLNIMDESWHSKVIHRTGDVFEFPKWFVPICPSNYVYQEFMIEKFADSLLNLPADVWLLDYLRFPYFWEKWGNVIDENEYPFFCYCDFCKQSFANEIKQDLENSSPEFIEKWQCLIIEKLVGKISQTIKKAQPKVQVGMQILPLLTQKKRRIKSEWVGQNVHLLQKHVDFFSPLLYGKLLNWSSDYILSYLIGFLNIQKLPVVPSLQISATRWDLQNNYTATSLSKLANRIKPMGINKATLFHARDLVNPENIQKTLGI